MLTWETNDWLISRCCSKVDRATAAQRSSGGYASLTVCGEHCDWRWYSNTGADLLNKSKWCFVCHLHKLADTQGSVLYRLSHSLSVHLSVTLCVHLQHATHCSWNTLVEQNLSQRHQKLKIPRGILWHLYCSLWVAFESISNVLATAKSCVKTKKITFHKYVFSLFHWLYKYVFSLFHYLINIFEIVLCNSVIIKEIKLFVKISFILNTLLMVHHPKQHMFSLLCRLFFSMW